jgi:hypothetical protein
MGGISLWVFAVLVAALGPLVLRALVRREEARMAARTRQILARAQRDQAGVEDAARHDDETR